MNHGKFNYALCSLEHTSRAQVKLSCLFLPDPCKTEKFLFKKQSMECFGFLLVFDSQENNATKKHFNNLSIQFFQDVHQQNTLETFMLIVAFLPWSYGIKIAPDLNSQVKHPHFCYHGTPSKSPINSSIQTKKKPSFLNKLCLLQKIHSIKIYAVVTELLRISYGFPNRGKKVRLNLEKDPYLNRKHHELQLLLAEALPVPNNKT